MFDSIDTPARTPVVAVIMMFQLSNRLDHFDRTLQAVESRFAGVGLHIYLCCEGPLGLQQRVWLTLNEERIHKVICISGRLGRAASLKRVLGVLEGEELVLYVGNDAPTRHSLFVA